MTKVWKNNLLLTLKVAGSPCSLLKEPLKKLVKMLLVLERPKLRPFHSICQVQ